MINLGLALVLQKRTQPHSSSLNVSSEKCSHMNTVSTIQSCIEGGGDVMRGKLTNPDYPAGYPTFNLETTLPT